MRKKINKYLVIIPVVCFLLLSGSRAYGLSLKTEASVYFEEGFGPTYPVDPDEPDVIYPEPDPEEPPLESSFAIVAVSNFDFGTAKVLLDEYYYDVLEPRPNIQVVDLRGAGTGWKVTAKATSFTTTFIGEDEVEVTEDSLSGAEIHITDGVPNSLSISPPPVQESVQLTMDNEPVTVIRAAVGAGTGLQVMRWYSEDHNDKYVKLYVPPGVGTLGDHTAFIYWTLEDTPND